MNRRRTVAFALALGAIVVVPGLANAVLGRLGYPTVGSAVWAVGYGTGALLVWYVWIRPIGITGPDGAETDEK